MPDASFSVRKTDSWTCCSLELLRESDPFIRKHSQPELKRLKHRSGWSFTMYIEVEVCLLSPLIEWGTQHKSSFCEDPNTGPSRHARLHSFVQSHNLGNGGQESSKGHSKPHCLSKIIMFVGMSAWSVYVISLERLGARACSWDGWKEWKPNIEYVGASEYSSMRFTCLVSVQRCPHLF